MAKNMSARRRAIRRRNLFLAVVAVVLVAIISLLCALIVWISSLFKDDKKAPEKPSDSQSQAEDKKEEEPEYVKLGNYTLDANYTNLLLVNGKNPLPEDYDYEGALVTMDDKYRQTGYDLTQINGDMYPYLQALCEAAWEDNVDIAVCSPYRSYQIQQTLFNRQVNTQLGKGLSKNDAEKAAAAIVARPGTSEHHTGLAVDFICSNMSFEGMPAFTWLQENAADYGFILRYPKDKQEQTGVIYEPWHYRFVGIKEAKAIKASGLCLEEYLDKQAK